MTFFQSENYSIARGVAELDATILCRPMGLEKAIEYGREVFRVKMIPKDPKRRFGWETRCEVVEPV